jgi:hypothetical protein
MKHILLITFHYPPVHGSSGLQRPLAFSRYLPAYRWQPIILTAHPRAYPRRGDDQLAEIPPAVPVIRTFAVDAARHLALYGKYIRCMALPDRWPKYLNISFSILLSLESLLYSLCQNG